MEDAFLLTERYRWDLGVIGAMEFTDFIAYVDAAKLMYEKERKAAEAAAKGR